MKREPSNKPKEIEIVIPADGSEPTIEMIGYEGTGCSLDASELIRFLGAKDLSVNKKSEYFKLKQKTRIENKR